MNIKISFCTTLILLLIFIGCKSGNEAISIKSRSFTIVHSNESLSLKFSDESKTGELHEKSSINLPLRKVDENTFVGIPPSTNLSSNANGKLWKLTFIAFATKQSSGSFSITLVCDDQTVFLGDGIPVNREILLPDLNQSDLHK